MKRLIPALMLISLAVVAGCSGISVSTDYDTSVDFSEYNTFSWMEPPKSGGYDLDALMSARIKDAVDNQLVEKGLKKASSDPDLLVVYHTGKQSQIQIDSWGYGYWGRGGGVDAYSYEEGTLVVDLVNAATRMLVWRGTAESALLESPSAQERTENINKAVVKIFASYPPSK